MCCCCRNMFSPNATHCIQLSCIKNHTCLSQVSVWVWVCALACVRACMCNKLNLIPRSSLPPKHSHVQNSNTGGSEDLGASITTVCTLLLLYPQGDCTGLLPLAATPELWWTTSWLCYCRFQALSCQHPGTVCRQETLSLSVWPQSWHQSWDCFYSHSRITGQAWG